MDYEHPDFNDQYLPKPVSEPPLQDSSNGMSRAAFVCGIMSLIGIFFNASLFFGAFAILFALLSRRNRLSRMAKAAVRMAVVGISIFALIIVSVLVILISSGLVQKYAKRISEVNPNDPAAVSKLENDLIGDLAKKYGIDPSSLQSDQGNDDSPFDPTIENDNRSASSADSKAESVSENAESDSSSRGTDTEQPSLGNSSERDII